MMDENPFDPQPSPERRAYQRVYRIFNFACIGIVVTIFSIALSRSLGVIGLILPWLLIAIMYGAVSFMLDVAIFFLELRAGEQAQFRRPKRTRYYK